MSVKMNIYESQAFWSVVLAAVGGITFLGAAGMILPKFEREDFEVVMRAGGGRFYAILGAFFVAGAASLLGSLLGFSSAGHKRNKKSGMSWAGFFINALVMAVTLSLFAFFWFAKELVQMPQ